MTSKPQSKIYIKFKEKIDKIHIINNLFVNFFTHKKFEYFAKIFLKEEDEDFLNSYTKFKKEFISTGELTPYLMESALIQVFSAFEVYLTSFFISYFEENPNSAFGKIKIEVRDIMTQKDLASAKQILITSLSESLSHYKIEDLVKDAKKIIDKELLKKINTSSIKKLRIIRNLYTHQGGIINSTFIKNLKGEKEKLKIGERYQLSVKEFYGYLNDIDNFVMYLDLQTKEVKSYFILKALQNLASYQDLEKLFPASKARK